MARHTYVPDRGDLVHVNFQPPAGREQTGPRYAIILSPREYNRAAGLAVCCPITTQVKGYPFEVAVQGERVRGVVLADQVKSVDWRERAMQFAETADEHTLNTVTQRAAALIGGAPTQG